MIKPVKTSICNITKDEISYKFMSPSDLPLLFSAPKGIIPPFGTVDMYEICQELDVSMSKEYSMSVVPIVKHCMIKPRKPCSEPRDVNFTLFLKDSHSREEQILMLIHQAPTEHEQIGEAVHFNSYSTPSARPPSPKAAVTRRAASSNQQHSGSSRHNQNQMKFVQAPESSVHHARAHEWTWRIMEIYPVVILCIGLHLINAASSISLIAQLKHFAPMVFAFGFVLGFLTRKYIFPIVDSSAAQERHPTRLEALPMINEIKATIKD